MHVIFVDGKVLVEDSLIVDHVYDVIDDRKMPEVWAETPEVVYWKGIDLVIHSCRIHTLYILPEARLIMANPEAFKFQHREYIGLPDSHQNKRWDYVKKNIWISAFNILMAMKPSRMID